MKQCRYIIAIFLMLSMAFACKKEPETQYDLVKYKNSGTVSASLNGKTWQSDLVITGLVSGSDQRIYIMADVYINGTRRQGLSIMSVKLSGEKQSIYNGMRWSAFDQTGWPRGKDTCIASFHLSDGDAGENSYGILEDEDNFIQLEGYSGSSSQVKGNFQLNFYRSKPDIYSQTQGLPDTLRFTNGKFDVQLMK